MRVLQNILTRPLGFHQSRSVLTDNYNFWNQRLFITLYKAQQHQQLCTTGLCHSHEWVKTDAFALSLSTSATQNYMLDVIYKTAEHHISILAKGERKWRKLLILLCGSSSYISFSFSFTVLVELCEGLLFAASPIIPSAPKMPISLSSIWVIRFHPSHRLFSCLRNHSTVGLTMPLGD